MAGDAIRTRPPSRLDHAWFDHLGLSALTIRTEAGTPTKLVRLLPQRWTLLHRVWARSRGLRWGPCPECREDFGGHQAGASVTFPQPADIFGGVVAPFADTYCAECTRLMTGVATPRRSGWAVLVIACLFVEACGLLGFSIVLGGALAGDRPGDSPWWVYLVGTLLAAGGTAVVAGMALTVTGPCRRGAR